jgi:Concanavalin A-like lectin/glucanases superfamily
LTAPTARLPSHGAVISTPLLLKLRTALLALQLPLVACSGGKFEAKADAGSAGGSESQVMDNQPLPDAAAADEQPPVQPPLDDSAPPNDDDSVGLDSGAPTSTASPPDPSGTAPPPTSTGPAPPVPSGDPPVDSGLSAPEPTTGTEPPAPTPCSLDDGSCADAGLPMAPPLDASPPPSDDPPPADLDSGGPPPECPDFPEQQLRGSCGCGFESTPQCEFLEEHLIHRYSFDGTGSIVVDSVGGADGEAKNVTLDGSGVLVLDGDSQYVELPSGIASSSSSATFEFWIRWHGGDTNQRVFNFGTPLADDAPQEFVSFSPAGGSSDPLPTVSYRTDDQSSGSARADNPFPTGDVVHVTVIFDQQNAEVAVYFGTELVALGDELVSLVDLADSVNWLGRALYSGYPNLDGELLEFRIYDESLDAALVSQSDALGASATFSQ